MRAPSVNEINVGILSLVQMSRIRLFKGYYLGTGLITVVGTSFATLSTASAVGILGILIVRNLTFYLRSSAQCTRMGHAHRPQELMDLLFKGRVLTLMAKCWVCQSLLFAPGPA